MGEKTSISWCDSTFNPWRGCAKVSPGCAHCYAETLSRRNPSVLGEWGPDGMRVVASEAKWREPEAWDRVAVAMGGRLRVFCASLADVFEDWPGPMVSAKGLPLWWCRGSLASSPIPSAGLPEGCRLATMADVRERLWQLIRDTPHLDWLLLTKRPENWRKCWPLRPVPGHVSRNEGDGKRRERFPNVWLGVSVEDQARADERIPRLLETPAAVRFISAEPLLGPVDLTRLIYRGEWLNPLDTANNMAAPLIDWVIVGGESGPGARPCYLPHVQGLVDQCRAAGVACFVKQLGSRPVLPHDRACYDDPGPGHGRPGLICDGSHPLRLRDPKGGDSAEWPVSLRVREFPTSLAAGGEEVGRV